MEETYSPEVVEAMRKADNLKWEKDRADRERMIKAFPLLIELLKTLEDQLEILRDEATFSKFGLETLNSADENIKEALKIAGIE